MYTTFITFPREPPPRLQPRVVVASTSWVIFVAMEDFKVNRNVSSRVVITSPSTCTSSCRPSNFAAAYSFSAPRWAARSRFIHPSWRQ